MRDALLGRIFGLGSIVRAGMLGSSSGSDPDCTSAAAVAGVEEADAEQGAAKRAKKEKKAGSSKKGRGAVNDDGEGDGDGRATASDGTGRPGPGPGSQPAPSTTCRLVQQLLWIAGKKSFLREAVAGVIAELAACLTSVQLQALMRECTPLAHMLQAQTATATPEVGRWAGQVGRST